MAVYTFLRNILASIEILKKKNSRKFWPSFHCELTFKVYNVFFCLHRQVWMRQPGERHILPEKLPQCPHWTHSSGLSSSGDPVIYNQLTNSIRNQTLSTSPQLTACHKWHRTSIHCLLAFSQKYASWGVFYINVLFWLLTSFHHKFLFRSCWFKKVKDVARTRSR